VEEISKRLLLTLLKRKLTHGPIGVLFWALKGFNVPAPNFVKKKILKRRFIKYIACVETGTYLGETTKFLAKNAQSVFTIEPQRDLYNFSKNRLSKLKNTTFVFGTSEEFLPQVIEKLNNCSAVNFWLDGHYSGGITYQGVKDSPIVSELSYILPFTRKLREVIIAIDDFRDFSLDESGYVARSTLVSYAEKFGLSWDVQFDIFFMEKREDF
jgi:hypothetical protein